MRRRAGGVPIASWNCEMPPSCLGRLLMLWCTMVYPVAKTWTIGYKYGVFLGKSSKNGGLNGRISYFLEVLMGQSVTISYKWLFSWDIWKLSLQKSYGLVFFRLRISWDHIKWERYILHRGKGLTIKYLGILLGFSWTGHPVLNQSFVKRGFWHVSTATQFTGWMNWWIDG